jgi:hypothetical protein
MKTYTYHNEIKILLAQVMNALDDLVIRRFNEINDTTYTDKINVSLVYAPKQRLLSDLVSKNQHIQLPVMALAIGGISFQKERAFNKIYGFTVDEHTKPEGGRFPQPIPIDLKLNFSVLTHYQRDVEQIITNIFNNFFPYIVISYRHPDLGHEVRCIVEWDGNIGLTYPIDIPAQNSYRVAADSSFVVKGWIYRNASNPWGMIYNIPVTFTSVSALYDDFDAMQALEGVLTTDYRVVSGRPQLTNVYPYFTNIGVTSVQFDLIGDMFNRVENIALSGTENVLPVSSYQLLNPFVSSEYFSAMYQPFSAVPMLTSQWSVINDHHIQLTLPVTNQTGYIDIFAWGPIGLGQLKLDCIRPTLNPYVSGSTEYNNYTEYQYPCVSGIQIKN